MFLPLASFSLSPSICLSPRSVHVANVPRARLCGENAHGNCAIHENGTCYRKQYPSAGAAVVASALFHFSDRENFSVPLFTPRPTPSAFAFFLYFFYDQRVTRRSERAIGEASRAFAMIVNYFHEAAIRQIHGGESFVPQKCSPVEISILPSTLKALSPSPWNS